MKISDKIKNSSGIIARMAVGGIFAYAGFLKAAAPPEEFALAIESYKIFPSSVAAISALIVPWAEIYLGIFLILGLFAKPASITAISLLIFFELLILSAIIRGIPIENCGCFGSSDSNTPSFELFQNIILICLAFLSYKFGGKFSIDRLIQKKQNLNVP